MVFSYRREDGYTTGIAFWAVGEVIFFVGFVTPFWTTVDGVTQKGHQGSLGLWAFCTTSQKPEDFSVDKDCNFVSLGSLLPGWFRVVQILQSLSLTASLTTLIYLFVVNVLCTGKKSRACEYLASLAVALGLVSLAVYGTALKTASGDRNIGILYGNVTISFRPKDHTSWSFIVDLIGLLVILVAAIFIGAFAKPSVEKRERVPLWPFPAEFRF